MNLTLKILYVIIKDVTTLKWNLVCMYIMYTIILL
jgi:hypothetical protein